MDKSMVEINIDQAVSQFFPTFFEALVPGASDPPDWLPWGGKDGAVPKRGTRFEPVELGEFQTRTSNSIIWVCLKIGYIPNEIAI